MALWLVRAGRSGQYEQQFLDEGRICLRWGGLTSDIRDISDREAIKAELRSLMPDASAGKIANGAGQIWAFADGMSVGDWFVLPSKQKRVIHIGEVASELQYAKGAGPYRQVKWLETDIPRSNFDQDLLYSFGAFMTYCQISRNDAESRVKAMARTGWKSTGVPLLQTAAPDSADGDNSVEIDIESMARDQIARLILARFKGHGLEQLVDALLRAQGYTTFVSPEGADKGVDILAAPGPLGFGEPRICVQVKSGEAPLDRPTLDQLIGTMQNVQAKQGLLVSWGGFKSSVHREEAQQFFRVRLWDQDELIDQVLQHYERIDDELRAELPLKRIWAVADSEGED